jgi:hypothetical protein
MASVSDLGKGNGRAATWGASAAVNSLNIEGNQKRSDPDSVLKVETVVVTGVKAGTLIGSACGALRRG